MNLPIVFMYSGLGSQYYHMGRNLYEQNNVFKHYVNQADKLCNEMMGTSIIHHIYDRTNSPSQPFVKTTHTYPAIFIIEYALTQVMLEKHIFPSMVLGSSMGSYAASVTANILNLEIALQTIVTQAQLLDKHCPEGGMLAIIHDTQLYQTESYLHDFSELAGINFNSHFIVSGTNDNLGMIEDQLKHNNIMYQSLPVSHPFHSSYMDGANSYLLEAMRNIPMENPKIPFISCAHDDFLNALQPIHFWEMIRKPIQFQSTIQFLEKNPAIYLDLGPSGTLATFVKYNLSPHSPSRSYHIITPYGQDVRNLESILAL